MSMFVNYKHKQHGFTLIEVLVSLSIFTIVVTISVSVLYSLIDANARSRNSQSVATNLSFMLDSMTREIRTGTHYYCVGSTSGTLPPGDPFLGISNTATQDCALGFGLAFAFNEGGQSLTRDAGSRRIAYRLYEGALQRRLGNGEWLNLTADDVVVEDLRFRVVGSTVGDDLAPTVNVYINGRVGDEENTRDTFDVQSTVTMRLLDI